MAKAEQPRRRSRSNDGTPNKVSRVIPIDPGLFNKLMVSFYEPIVGRGTRVFHGPKEGRGCPAVRFTDEQVLVIRKMRDWHGMSVAKIAEALGVTAASVEPIAGWRNRVHLDPGPRPADLSEA